MTSRFFTRTYRAHRAEPETRAEATRASLQGRLQRRRQLGDGALPELAVGELTKLMRRNFDRRRQLGEPNGSDGHW